MPATAKMSLAILFMLGTCVQVAWAATCPDDPEVAELCDDIEVSGEVSGAMKLHATPTRSLILMLIAALRPNGVKNPNLAMLILPLASVLPKGMAAGQPETTCGDVKTVFKEGACCGSPSKKLEVQIVPNPTTRLSGSNPCEGKKALTQPGLNNIDCFKDGVRQAGAQSGADVTKGYQGDIKTTVTPITIPYYKTTMCPVNVHWHLGAEHRSAGEFDESGTSPQKNPLPSDDNPEDTRRLATPRYGYACKKYTTDNVKFNTEYPWRYCKDMHVGETYEVHWPHSALGACGTPNQYQDPFYDGVFCGATESLLKSLTPQDIASSVGVQGQVFTIINDENYYYPDLIRGMIVDSDNNMGIDIAVYTGSTTGTTRNNQVCSAYMPITWQVDRKCHLISASSFDKMCADMMQMRDDMSGDLHPHGARELVWSNLTANNQQDLVA